ncbi:hypothetical protein BOO88_07645 [Stutzerimonas stutzeri]|nr:hypothetical protein BOO89_11235 [Stutzerimonas stutzeri]AZO88805.1 hypothetical protein BOO88_07645 [Stutzerimonas stutzeri]
MFSPAFCLFSSNVWVAELKVDILKIASKTLTQEALNIFKDESAGFGFTDGLDCCRKHVPFVQITCVFSPKGKRLAGWAARNYFNTTGVRREIERTRISFE